MFTRVEGMVIDFTLVGMEPTPVKVTNVEDEQTAFSLRRRLDLSCGDTLMSWVVLCVNSEMCPGGFKAWVEYPVFGRTGAIVVCHSRADQSGRDTEMWLEAIDRALAGSNLVLEV